MRHGVSRQENDLARFPQLGSTPKVAHIPSTLSQSKSLLKSDHCLVSELGIEGYHPDFSDIFKYLYL